MGILVGEILSSEVKRDVAIAGDEGVVAVAAKVVSEEIDDVFFVVNDEDSFSRARGGRRTRGGCLTFGVVDSAHMCLLPQIHLGRDRCPFRRLMMDANFRCFSLVVKALARA